MTTDKLTSDLQTYETHSFNAVPEPVAIHREYDHSKDLIKNFSADFARYPIEKRNRNQRANIFHPFR